VFGERALESSFPPGLARSSLLSAENRKAFGEVGIEGPVPRGLESRMRAVDERE
jgi:hypothetical protein